jgi:hypothetical protein
VSSIQYQPRHKMALCSKRNRFQNVHSVVVWGWLWYLVSIPLYAAGRVGGGGMGGANKEAQLLDPDHIRFSHSKIFDKFSCGRAVQQTLSDIEAGSLSIEELPTITVIDTGVVDFAVFNQTP